MENKIYIFGAGENGIALLSQLNEYREVKIEAYIDNDKQKQNISGGGVECISVDEAIKRGAQDDIILVSVSKSDEIMKQLKEHNFSKVFCVAGWIGKRKYYKPVVMYPSDFKNAMPFNHYDSPYPDIVDIHEKEDEIFSMDKEILDIDFNVERQLELMKQMENFELPDWPMDKDSNSKYRYYYNNTWFVIYSAHALYYMMRVLQPKKIIEVGSGYSTALMLDVNEQYFSNEIKISSIEPRASRLKSLIKPSDNIEIYEEDLQQVPVKFFESLGENDILFIDSSHVSKIGSDVNYIFFEILPRLKSGVYIHFHDIFYPFVYLKSWIYAGTAYNEMYILRAFLMNNKDYSIQLFGEMLSQKCPEKISEKLLGCGQGSIWIKKN